jgi:hypothetical protein
MDVERHRSVFPPVNAAASKMGRTPCATWLQIHPEISDFMTISGVKCFCILQRLRTFVRRVKVVQLRIMFTKQTTWSSWWERTR